MCLEVWALFGLRGVLARSDAAREDPAHTQPKATQAVKCQQRTSEEEKSFTDPLGYEHLNHNNITPKAMHPERCQCDIQKYEAEGCIDP